MNDPRIRELLDLAADLAGDDLPRPTAAQFQQRRQARRRAFTVTVASVAVVAVVVGLGAALTRERASSPPTNRHLTTAPQPGTGHRSPAHEIQMVGAARRPDSRPQPGIECLDRQRDDRVGRPDQH